MEAASAFTKQKDTQKASFEIIGMYQSEKEYFYKIKGLKKVMSREEVLEKDPIALVLFYEANLKVNNNWFQTSHYH